MAQGHPGVYSAGRAPCPQRMGTILVRDAHAGPLKGVGSVQRLRPLPCAPLCTGGAPCPVGAAASRTAGTLRLGTVEPTKPALLGGEGCSACPGESRLGSPACCRCQTPARSPARGLKPASRRGGGAAARAQAVAGSAAQRSAAAAEAGLCAKGSRNGSARAPLSLAFRSGSGVVLGVRQEIRTPGVHVCRWGCREGAGRDVGVGWGLQGSVLPTPTSLCRRDGLCVGVGGWTVCLGRTCLQRGTTEG